MSYGKIIKAPIAFPSHTVQNFVTMDLPTRPHDALAQPTRAQLFTVLERAAPAGEHR